MSHLSIKNTFKIPLGVVLLAGLTVLSLGCADETASETSPEPKKKQEQAPPFGSQADVQQGDRIWDAVSADYHNWDLFPGTSLQQLSQAPHGVTADIYISPSFNVEEPAVGDTVIKKNYDENEQVVATTVMHRLEGYNPDNFDWFWIKLDPAGEIAINPNNKLPMAGAIGKGGDKGCIPCHAGSKTGTYLLTSDLVAAGNDS